MRHALAVVFVLGAASTATAATVDDVRWLAGCWSGGDGDHHVEEQWMSPAGGTMLGMSRTVRGGVTRAHEFMRIEENSGRLVFVARPSGQEGASFPSISVEPARIVFELKEHDFPQRVIYQQNPDGGLLGRIEGEVDGKPEAVDFAMNRVSCPGAGP